MRPENDPQANCESCFGGAIPCEGGFFGCERDIALHHSRMDRLKEQAQQSQDQEPFTAPAHAGEFAELGMMAVPMRRYANSGVYCSPAEEEAIKLSRVEEAVLENVLAADTASLLTEADMVNLPAHYARFKIEPIRFIVENGLNWFQGNINKYSSRAEHKHATPLEDILKIIRYAEMWYDYASGDPNWWMTRSDPRRVA